jgi:hypothetical protein
LIITFDLPRQATIHEDGLGLLSWWPPTEAASEDASHEENGDDNAAAGDDATAADTNGHDGT